MSNYGGKKKYRPSNGSGAQPDGSVKQMESKIIANATASNRAVDFPHRPAYGGKGGPVSLWANYVPITLDKSQTLHHYIISIDKTTPMPVGKKLVQIVKLLLRSEPLASHRDDIVTDFKDNLLSRKKLPIDDAPHQVQYQAENEDQPRPSARVYTVRLAYNKQLPFSDLKDYLRSDSPSALYHAKAEMVQALNIFLNHYSKDNDGLVTIGAGKSFPLNEPGFDLGSGLVAIRGYYASVRLATARLLVNVNVSHAAFYREGSLADLMKENSGSHLKRLRVKPTHLPTDTRIKTIFGRATANDGKELEHPPQVRTHGADSHNVKFWWTNQGTDGYISVAQFFKKKYNIQLRQPDMSVVNVGNLENPVYLPPELCKVMPGQIAKVQLDPQQTTRMIGFAVRKPAENATDIESLGLRSVGLTSGSNRNLERFGVEAEQKLIMVDGRVLQKPTVTYLNGSVNRDTWNLATFQFSDGRRMPKWSYVLITDPTGHNPYKNGGDLDDLERLLKSQLQGNGVTYEDPTDKFTIDDPTAAENLFRRLKGSRIGLVFIILPGNVNANTYNHIKGLGDIRYGITTICVDGRNLKRSGSGGSIPYVSNITMKFNLKLGGVNQRVDFSMLTKLNFDKTMIVGIDVTHPSPSSSPNAPSIAGMVASIDGALGQWPAVVRLQAKARDEMVTELKDMLSSRLKLWVNGIRGANRNRRPYPNNILVYRDGVSEGQYQTVLEKELPLLRAACRDLYPPSDWKNGLPKFTIVIVGKRHHTRFYPTDRSRTYSEYNPPPGTVVDRGVTEARNWDFYLQSHLARKGTARPVHYFVIRDEIFQNKPPQEAADELEALTNGLCYINGRASLAVRVCTPVYYADLACERARCYLGNQSDGEGTQATSGGGTQGSSNHQSITIHPDLVDSMFYI
ncbi:Piwi-domain-containing protein [Hypoxylon sp. NC1633]|nr:Piwi-domain-containing protein [Hypoxylon sp. NC1633]